VLSDDIDLENIDLKNKKGKPMTLISECRRNVVVRPRVHAMLMLVLLCASLAGAQTTISTGSIQGVITDSSGAVVAGAKVTITDKSTGQVIAITSTS
jgi:hypothetical protein